MSEWRQQWIRAELAAWAAELPQRCDQAPAATCLYAGRNRIFRFEHPIGPIVVKHFRNHGLKRKLAYRWRSSKAQRAIAHAEALRAAGFLSPEPFGWLERWRHGWLDEAFACTAYCVHRFSAWDLKGDAAGQSHALLHALGGEIGRLHAAAMRHLDLTPGNVLLVPDAGQAMGYRFAFIDCNRMAFGPVSFARGLADLVMMGYEGDRIAPYVRGYAEQRGYDVVQAEQRYGRLLRWHQRKWALKNGTRAWRRRFGC